MLTDSQHIGYDHLEDRDAVIEAQKARFLASCLRELGANPLEGWRFDRATRVFWRDIDDNAGQSQP